VTKKPDEFSDTTGSACKGCNAGGQPFNERLPHALIIMASPSQTILLQRERIKRVIGIDLYKK
jgi:hypothetical protein